MKTIVKLCAWISCLMPVMLAHAASSITGYNANVSETNAVAIVQVERTGDLETTVSVDYTTADGSATNGGDYVATSGALTFLPGVSNLTVSIPLMNDAMPETSESFTLVLTNATGGATVSEAHPHIYITDNDLGIRFSNYYYTNTENAGIAVVTILRGEDENFPATVTFYTQNAAAQAGTDYVATNGTLEFAADELSKTVAITILNDLIPELTESFTFRLGTVTGPTALGSLTSTLVRIYDNDTGFQAEQSTYVVRETAGSLVIHITRGLDETNAATVDFATQDGTALAGQDYIATNGTLSFAQGELSHPIYLVILNNSSNLNSSEFTLNLSNPTGGMALGTNKNIRIAIQDADLPILRQITTGPMVTERADYWTAAWPDYDNDGDVDLFVTAGLYFTNYNRLYRNDGNGVFSKMTTNEVGDLVGDWGVWMGSSWGDVDNDGDLDVYVCEFDGQRAFYRNDGGRFTRLTDAGAIVTNFAITQSAVWGDYDNDGRLDLLKASGIVTVTSLPPSRIALYHNEGTNQFTLVTNSAMGLHPANQTEIAAWGDYDDDGDLDAVVSDHGITGMRNILLFNNDGLNGFSLVTTGVVATYNSGGFPLCWGDFDNDGRLDLYFGWNTTSYVFFNDGNGNWTQVNVPTVTTAIMPAWGDLDNDGDLDLFTCGGQGSNVRNQIFINTGNRTFVERTNLAPAMFSGRSAEGSWADYDDDGNLDLYVTHIATVGTNLLYHNEGTGKHWLKVKLVGTASNRAGIGAKVRVKAVTRGQTVWQRRDLSGGHRTQSDTDLRPHFGLGDATSAEVIRIEWPSGIVQELHNISADQIITVPETSQGASVVEAFNANVNERDVVATVQVQRTTDLDTLVNVGYYTEDGTATNGGDFVATSGTLTFLPGVSNLTVSIPLINDALPEYGENFTLVLSNPTGGATVSDMHPRIYITDNDLGIHMSSQYYTNTENAGFAVLTVLRGEDEDFPATVAYATANGTAQAGADYVTTTGIVEFAVGEFAKTVAASLVNDFMPEAAKTFQFRLGAVTGATALGTPNVALVRIVDDDAGIQLEKTVYYVRYNAGSVTIGVTADASLPENVTVAYYTTNGTAVAGVDYAATSGTLTFTPGQSYQTVTIPILDDGMLSANKSFELRLGTVTGPTGLGMNKTATIHIRELFSMTLTGNRADYTILNETPPLPSRLQAQTLVVGLYSIGFNAAFVFELPPLESGANILSAQLSFRLNSVNASPNYNVDLWGIGFQAGTVPIAEYFAGQSGDPDNHKLQDNILTPATPVATWITSATNSGLAAYLQSFYDANPQYGGGSYVFLRLSQDTAVTNSSAHYYVNSADSATPPTLMITASGGDMLVCQQPASQSVSLGALAQFTCTAAGGMPPLTYQWWREAAALPNATGSSLVITNAQLADVGSYYLVIRDGDGMTLTSRVVTLEVDPSFTQITDSPVVNYNTYSAGCLWGDYDNDGYPDLIIPNMNGTLELCHNNGNGTFNRMTAAQVGDIVNTTTSYFANWGDYNNDGYLDVIVGRGTSTEGCVMFRNNGNGTFTRLWARSDAMGGLWGDFNNDGWLDLFPIWVWGSWGQYNCLLQNNQGNLIFTKRTDNPMSANTLSTEGADAVDLDGDGDLDITSAGYTHQGVACLYRNDGNMQFTRIYNALTTPDLNPLGFAWGDYDNDGHMDVYTSRYEAKGNSHLFHNDGGGQFSTNTSLEMPVGLGNGVWGDYDNDGDLDLFIWGGMHALYPSIFYSNNGDGTFTRIMRGSLVNNLPLSAACAWADYDNNGFLDLVVCGNPGPVSLFRNNGNTNKWLLLKLVGTASNRAAIGTKVRTRATIFGKTVWQRRDIHGGNRMQNDLRAHFGLGDAGVAEVVRIEWPSGIVQELTNVVAGQILTITEPPKCASPCVMNGSLEFTLTGNVGETFELLEADAVDSQSWAARQTIILTNRTQTISEPTSQTATQKYYQIRRVP